MKIIEDYNTYEAWKIARKRKEQKNEIRETIKKTKQRKICQNILDKIFIKFVLIFQTILTFKINMMSITI